MISFLRNGLASSSIGVKVNWGSVYKPISEGGLGLRRIEECNKAAIMVSLGHCLLRQVLYGFFIDARSLLIFGVRTGSNISLWHD